jgi:hypothetical protein
MWDFGFWQQSCITLLPSGVGWVWCCERLFIEPFGCPELLTHCHSIASQKAWVKASVTALVEYHTVQKVIARYGDG